MRLIQIGIPLLLPALILLQGCDSETTAQKQARFLQTHVGQYSGAAVINGQARQWRLGIHGLGAVLTRLDDRDSVSVQDGTPSNNQLTFGSSTVCVPQGDDFACTLDNTAVTLSKLDNQTIPDLASLAGDYQWVHEQATGTLTLDSNGHLSATLPACSLQGTLSIEADQLRLQVTHSNCGSSGQIGVVQASTLNHSDDALEVWIPDSPLAGIWLR